MSSIDKSKNSLAPGRPYLDALLFWKGLITESELVNLNVMPQTYSEAEPWLIKAYAVAYKAQLDNKNSKAIDVLKKILASGYWSYYPFIMAETDLNKLNGIKAPETEVIELKGAPAKKQ